MPLTKIIGLERLGVMQDRIGTKKRQRFGDGFRRAIQTVVVGEDEHILLQLKATVDATEKLEKAEQPNLPGAPSALATVQLPTIPRLHEPIWAAVDPDVLERGDLKIDMLEGKIIARQFVAGVAYLALCPEVLPDALDLAKIVAIANVAGIEEGVGKNNVCVVGAEVKALHGAVDVWV